jgi:hypothetical protein
MQALKQRLVEEGRGVQPALDLEVSEKTSVFVPMIGSVKKHLRQGIMDLAHLDVVILSFE